MLEDFVNNGDWAQTILSESNKNEILAIRLNSTGGTIWLLALQRMFGADVREESTGFSCFQLTELLSERHT